jgi:excisionase family DNA binding protein
MIEQHYTTRELAKLLRVNPETVLRLAQRGELSSVRVGSERRYAESGIRAYLEEGAEGSAVPLRRRVG